METTLKQSGNIFELEDIPKEFSDYYCKSNKGRKRLKLLMKNIDAEISPIKNEESGVFSKLKITGKDSDRAKMIIKSVSTKLKNKFTHLITIPFTKQEFVEAFLEFKSNVIKMNFQESLFQNPKKLHLTIACLSLHDEEQIGLTKELLRRECEEFVQSFDYDSRLRIKGVGIMNNIPEKTNILYAKIENNEKLQILANKISQKMRSNGLLYNDKDASNVKLHLTLMNTSYIGRKIKGKRHRKNNKYFDSTGILKIYGEHLFCEVDMPMIHLNELHNVGEDGYYKVIEVIKLLEL